MSSFSNSTPLTAGKRKLYPIPGGVHPPQNKHQSTQAPLQTAPLPDRVYLPINQHIGAPARMMVEPGQRVLKGELVAQAAGMVSANVHASISGMVADIIDHPLPHASGMSGRCVVIDSDGKDEWIECLEHEQPLAVSNEELLKIIRKAGIVGMGGAGFPAAVKANPRNDTKIDTLIINGTECEPYITSDDMLMRTYASEIVRGTEIMAKLLGEPENVLIGLEDNEPEALAALQNAALGTSVEVVAFPGQYPSGGEKQIIQRLTGREVPSGELPASIGCVVQNVGTVYAIYRAVRFGEPLISRVTTLVGEALSHSGNVVVRLGTPINDLLELFGYQPQNKSKLIIGGPMMGFAVTDLAIPVVKTTNCIIAPSVRELPPAPPAQPCIRCGLCAEACPASLLPQQLYWYSRAEEFDKLEAHNLFDCIECGACSYACPSRIPLVQYYRAAKGTIRQAKEDKVKADRSRQRFEFRQQRLAKAEAEKEAKRLARAKAAAAAKQKMAEQQAAAVTAPPAKAPAAGQDDPVAKAIAKAQAKNAMSPEEKARADVEGLEQRLAKAKQKLADAQAEGSDKVAALQTGVDKLAVKLTTAKTELAAFDQGSGAQEPEPQAQAEDAAAAAIERAKAKAAAAATQSPEEKLTTQVASLKTRLEKAQLKVADAKRDGSEHLDALELGVIKITTKLEQAQAELATLQDS